MGRNRVPLRRMVRMLLPADTRRLPLSQSRRTLLADEHVPRSRSNAGCEGAPERPLRGLAGCPENHPGPVGDLLADHRRSRLPRLRPGHHAGEQAAHPAGRHHAHCPALRRNSALRRRSVRPAPGDGRPDRLRVGRIHPDGHTHARRGQDAALPRGIPLPDPRGNGRRLQRPADSHRAKRRRAGRHHHAPSGAAEAARATADRRRYRCGLVLRPPNAPRRRPRCGRSATRSTRTSCSTR